MATFTNLTFEQIEPGTSASVTRRLSVPDVEALALVSGDVDAFHIESGEIPAESRLAAKAVGAEALLSGLISRKLPGPGASIVSQELRFTGTVSPGDELVTTVTAREKRLDGSVIVFDCSVRRGSEEVVSGTMTVAAPTRSVTYTDLATPELILRFNDIFARLLKRCEGLPPVRCGIVHPCDRGALLGTVEAVRHHLIVPVLIGPEARVRAAAAAHGVDIAGWELLDVPHSHAAAETAVALARSGGVEALMKGSLHTDELMSAVVSTTSGLRTERRISHVFVMDVPSHPRMLLITDAAINIAPNAEAKAEIVQNAIDLARILGIAEPRVAILAAVEMVHANMPSTVDAAVLCKMADRGQIKGGILDGPLAFDNAVSEVAARAKQIVSPVAGRADILLAPDLDAGNMLAKQLQYLAGADSAGIVLGARVPIVLTSRADSVRGRLASAAVMALVANARRMPSPRQD